MQPSEDRSLTLMEIAETIASVFEALDSPDLTEDERAALSRAAEDAVTVDLAQKTDGVAWFIKRTESEVDQLKSLKQAVDDKIRAKQTRIASVRNLCRTAMQRIGSPKLTGKVYTISLRKGGDLVEITDFSAVPAAYQIIMPNKAAIKKALKDGILVPGTELIPGEETVSIR